MQELTNSTFSVRGRTIGRGDAEKAGEVRALGGKTNGVRKSSFAHCHWKAKFCKAYAPKDMVSCYEAVNTAVYNAALPKRRRYDNRSDLQGPLAIGAS